MFAHDKNVHNYIYADIFALLFYKHLPWYMLTTV